MPAEAERHWRLAAEKSPNYLPALIGLGELSLRQGRVGEFQQVLSKLTDHSHGQKEAMLLRARYHFTAEEFGAARALLVQIIESDPKFLPAKVLLSHVLLREGKDWDAAEKALREILAQDPNSVETKKNLEILLIQRQALRRP
jgi:tetratricopeptide (TPR) repeat protein